MSDFDLDRYKTWCDAYPEDIFTPLKGDPIKKTEDYDTPEKSLLITKASAGMGRHMIEQAVKPLIAEVERLRETIELLTTTPVTYENGNFYGVSIVDEIIGTNAYIDGELQPKIEGMTYKVLCCHKHATVWETFSRMIVCADCGDKRCPKALDCQEGRCMND